MTDLKCPECGSGITIGYYEAKCNNENRRKCKMRWDSDGRDEVSDD